MSDHPRREGGAVGPMKPAPVAAADEPLKPVLWEDIDPVLLVRTQASEDTTTLDAMKAKAMKTAEETAKIGAEVRANQQDDILTAEVPEPPARTMMTAPTPMPEQHTTAEPKAPPKPADKH